jgi:hypothetical protein
MLCSAVPTASRPTDAISGLDDDGLRQIVHALLRESVDRIRVSRRGAFVDFDVRALVPLSQTIPVRYRLYCHEPTAEEMRELFLETQISGLRPVAILPRGLSDNDLVPEGIGTISASQLGRLCEESATVVEGSGTYLLDRDALSELDDNDDPRMALLNGLLWLRPLSRDRVPVPLRWTGTPAHELFERCFFLSMVSTFGASGVRWGTDQRGRPLPDGRLAFRGVGAPILYDCKASRPGYEMTYRDLTGFVDYLIDPIETSWHPRKTGLVFFLVVSSQFGGESSAALFRRRQQALAKKAPGSRLVWMRAPDIARFGLAIERANVSHADRRAIDWRTILGAGQVGWSDFDAQLKKLQRRGYSVSDI